MKSILASIYKGPGYIMKNGDQVHVGMKLSFEKENHMWEIIEINSGSVSAKLTMFRDNVKPGVYTFGIDDAWLGAEIL